MALRENGGPIMPEPKLLRLLQEEKSMRLKGGLYHQTQIKLAYNSNSIEETNCRKTSSKNSTEF
jgi:hypothetical protein